jgi:hypothetical protein
MEVAFVNENAGSQTNKKIFALQTAVWTVDISSWAA